MKLSVLLVPVLGLSLSACAMQSGDFPSLAKRPYEDDPAIEEMVPTPAPEITALPADLGNAVSAAIRQSNMAHQAFLGSLPSARQRVLAAQGAAPSSESWVVAQMELSSLEMDRSPSVSALADMDLLYRQRLSDEVEGAQPGGAALVAESRDKIESQVASQQREIESLRSRLR
ncbi:hypothetical protein [Parasphingorhabdus sp.]|uniref:hypothetical protein n=1 Tax=Parasphingorhabdus sp. TaxID=2709688 RepID=UPI002F940FFC